MLGEVDKCDTVKSLLGSLDLFFQVVTVSYLLVDLLYREVKFEKKHRRRNRNDMTAPNERIEWIVRPTTSDDAEAIDNLLKVSYDTLLANDYDAHLLEKALPFITKARTELLTCGTWYLAEHPQDGTVVGCGGWTKNTPMKTSETLKVVPHLRHFATHPQYLRKGIARAIWQQIRNDVIEKCGAETDLEVYSTITAVPFYQSLGFQEKETIDIPLRSDCNFPSVLMERTGKSL